MMERVKGSGEERRGGGNVDSHFQKMMERDEGSGEKRRGEEKVGCHFLKVGEIMTLRKGKNRVEEVLFHFYQRREG